MRETIAVAIGGMIGSVLRFWVSVAIGQRLGGFMPFGTLAVNVAGCFAIGVLSGFMQRNQAFSPTWELAIRAGFLGGLTTFSTFGLEVFELGQSERWFLAMIIVTANILLGLGAVGLGQVVARLFHI